jgi:hypothetical protein
MCSETHRSSTFKLDAGARSRFVRGAQQRGTHFSAAIYLAMHLEEAWRSMEAISNFLAIGGKVRHDLLVAWWKKKIDQQIKS